MSPPELPPSLPPEGLTGETAATALLLAVTSMEPSRAEAALGEFLKAGIALAESKDPAVAAQEPTQISSGSGD